MTELTEKRAIGFISTIANRCTGCMRHAPDVCRNCISSWANEIMKSYEDDKKRELRDGRVFDYSMPARMMMIIDKIEKAGTPLLALDIDISDYCTKQLKYWTIRRMVNDGILGCKRSRGGNSRYRYFVKSKKAFSSQFGIQL